MAIVTRGAFAKRLCDSFGLKVTDHRKYALVAWQAAEGTMARFNPLATTKITPGSTDFNTTHVQNYSDVKIGVKATHDTLSEHHGQNYEPIVAALKANNSAEEILEAVAHSAWGTGPLALLTLPWVKKSYSAYSQKPIGQ